MAAVVYITVHGSNGATISLVCSKTKVAPLKRLTIPRLELTAALLLSRLMQYVQATLKFNVTETHLWTDSVVTLTWIKSHALRWKDFVHIASEKAPIQVTRLALSFGGGQIILDQGYSSGILHA
ncbi:uncharacterized protein LOC112459662 [Temnothorax curvispinosus]|uniref:Uncharacterized protein LOC112459662 n=1 Tax=Temnothorax curvispinosus TaxID=300111 RepID=A0A6J1QEC8_9HYME|nr:uncharacterized protein LOC112459662 [Temnothorax curvispinosus]